MRLLVLALLLCLAACQPERQFTRIVQFSAVGKLRVAGQHVYFMEDGLLKRVPKKGGAIEPLINSGVVDFDATAGHAYAATTTGVVHVAIATSGQVSITESFTTDPTLAVAAAETGVSWVTCTSLTHSSLDGITQVRVQLTGACANNATKLALDSSTAYGINTAGQWYASRSGGPVTALANEKCTRIEAGGGWLYCSDRDNGLRRFSPRTRDVESVIEGQVHTFAIGATRIYVGVGQDLVSSPRNSTMQDVMGTYAAISAIALDESDVYFVNTEGNFGLLLRTPQ